jgi:hypothetical protein
LRVCLEFNYLSIHELSLERLQMDCIKSRVDN